MTKFKSIIKRSTSMLISLMLLLSLIFPMMVSAEQINIEKTSGDSGLIDTQETSVKLVYGAQLQDGKYVWTPQSSAAGHKFMFNIRYKINGSKTSDSLKPGDVEMKIPKHILRDRNGEFADDIYIAIPSQEEAGSKNLFAYKEYEDCFLITINEKYIPDDLDQEGLTSSLEGNIDISYTTNKSTFAYRDMEKSDPFNVEIKDNLNDVSFDLGDISVYIDTSAKLYSTKKQTPAQIYTEWDNSWGDAPENADDYYYLIWPICSYIHSDITQAYKFELQDAFDEPDAAVVGYKMQGASTFTNENCVGNAETQNGELQGITNTGYRYDYVLTKYKKSTYPMQRTYHLKNTVTAKLTPIYEQQNISSKQASADFNHLPPTYKVPGERYDSDKFGNNNWRNHFPNNWETASYSLNDLQKGTKDCIDDNLKFYTYVLGYPYRHTLADGAEVTDISAFGTNNIRYELTDETLYMYFEDVTTEDNIRSLDCNDYEVKKIIYDWDIKDAKYNENTMEFEQVPPTYKKETDILHFYGKFNGNDEWIEIGTYNLATKKVNYDNRYVDLKNSGKGEISFYKSSKETPEINFCTAWKIMTENPYYYTNLSAYPYYRLKNSDYIMGNIEGKTAVFLKNTSNAKITKVKSNNTNAATEDEVTESEEPLYSSKNQAFDKIIGIDPHSQIKKRVTYVNNDKVNECANVGWQLDVEETYTTDKGVEYIPQTSGVFYDLLPAGVTLENKSAINVETEKGFLSENSYNVDVEPNYNGTGRTLVKITITEQADRYRVTFSAIYPWVNLKGYGTALTNHVAYETGNDVIAQGYPDDGGNIDAKKEMTDLDPSTDDKKFIYAQNTYEVAVETATASGLFKTIKASTDKNYSRNTTVSINSEYIYNLCYIKDANTKAKNLILFDSLENYKPNNKSESDWHGILQSVDTKSQLENKLGIDSVVYYSTIDNLDVALHRDLKEKINGQKVWLTEEEIGDISKAKAIAIDMSKDKNGDPFILDTANTIVVPIYMKAPKADTSSVEDPKAYNNVLLSYTSIDEFQREKDGFLEYYYTTAHLRVAADIVVYKADSTNPDKPVKNITFRLEGKSAYSGNIEPIDKTTGKDGKVKFEGIEKGEYTLLEYKGTDDYLRLEKTMKVEVDGNGKVFIDDKLLEDPYLTVLDEPRIHTNVVFYKKDLRDKTALKGFAFILSTPASAYGNKITMGPIKSGADGKVEFKNVEKGTYTLQEIRLSDDQYTEEELKTIDKYIISKSYKVKVEETGDFSIEPNNDDTQNSTDNHDSDNNYEYTKKGEYEIYNEPYHKFTIQKETFTNGLPIEGALFTLINRKNGKPVYMADQGKYSENVETDASGQFTFTHLESGSYTLQETHAPKGYILDDTPRRVEIDESGNTTIEGLKIDENKNFVVKNKEDGMLVITKRWFDKSDNEHRPNPVINVSSKLPDTTATFNITGNSYYVSGLINVASAYKIKSFAKGTKDEYEEWKQATGEEGVRLDDGKTQCSILAWCDSDGNVKWYSDAKTVYFPENSMASFGSLDYLETIDLSGINTSKVKDMSYMFFRCKNLTNLELGDNFDISNVEDMSLLFGNCSQLDSSDFIKILKKFDTTITPKDPNSGITSNLKNTNYMFAGCTGITKLDFSEFANFNTSQVTDMSGMFSECSNLELLDLNGLNTSNVENMSYMFKGCSNLKSLDLSSFNTAKVTNMQQMFSGCNNLITIFVSRDLWTTNKVYDSETMFKGCYSLYGENGTGDLSHNATDKTLACIDTDETPGYLTDRESVPYNCATFAKAENYVSVLTKITEAKNILSFSKGEESDYNAKDEAGEVVRMDDGQTKYRIWAWYDSSTGAVNWWSDAETVYLPWNSLSLFDSLTNLQSLDLSGIDSSRVANMAQMFSGCKALTSLTFGEKFNTSKVRAMSYMFIKCSRLQSLTFGDDFDTSKVTNMSYMFSECSALTSLTFGENFNTSNVINMTYMFYGCSRLTSLELGNKFDTSEVVSMGSMFSNCSSLTNLKLGNKFDTSKVYNMSSMFYYCQKLTSLELGNKFDTSSVTNMSSMFYCCCLLTSLKLGDNFDTSNVKYMSAMFKDCISLTELELGDKFDTSNVENMSKMFHCCSGLTSLELGDKFDTSNVKNMSNMFGGCNKLKSLTMNKRFEDSVVINEPRDASRMFSGCRDLTDLDLSGFNTANVTDMSYMFTSCSKLTELDLSSFNTAKVTNMQQMFYVCTDLTTIYVSGLWTTEGVNNSDNMFYNCEDLVGGTGEHPTYFDETKTNGEYARIHTESTPGYLTDIKDKPGYHETPAPTGANAPAVLTSINTVPDVSAINTPSPTALAPTALGSTDPNANTATNAIGDVTAELFELDNAERLNNVPVVSTGDDNDDNKDIYITTDPSNYAEEKYDKDTNTWTYDSKDDSSSVSYTLQKFEDKWVYTFSGLTPGLDYYVWEDYLDGYISSNTQEKPATVIDGKATITNTGPDGPHTFGDLFISKSVVASFPGDSESPTVEPTTGDLNRDFLFTITLIDEDNNPLEGTQSYDYLFFENGVATTSTSKSLSFYNGEVKMSLSSGESVKIIDIPAGYHYTVTETQVDGFEAQQKTFSGTIEEDTISEAKFVNKKLLTETTSITLKKLVEGKCEDNSEIFRFYASLNGLDAGKTYSLSNGDTYDAQSDKSAYVPISLQDGEEISFLDLPVGASYKITEEAGDYIASYEIKDAKSLNKIDTNAGANNDKNQSLSTNTETVDKVDDVLEDVTVTFTNYKHKTANLKLEKSVLNAAENNTDSFEFDIELKGLDTLTEYKTDFGVITSDSEGKYEKTITLSANEEIVFYALPVGAKYKITELANEYRASYKLVDSKNLGKIDTAEDSNATVRTDLSTAEETVNEGEDVTVTFKNEKVKKDLTVTKEVDFTNGNKDQSEYKNKEFTFDIAFTGLDRNTEYTIEYTQKDVTGIIKTENFTTDATGAYVLSVKLKHNQSVTIKDLATNATYQITEKAVKDYIASYSASGSENSIITKSEQRNFNTKTALSTEVETVDLNDMDVRFVYTNTVKEEPPEFGNLLVSKEVVSSFAGETGIETAHLNKGDLNCLFSFTITLKDDEGKPLEGSATYGGLEFENGVATTRLAHNESITITDIPADYQYTVTETPIEGFEAQQMTFSGTIGANATAEAKFVNKKLLRNTTSITLKKLVTGIFEDDSERFEFNIHLEGLDEEVTYLLSNGETYVTDDDGKADVTVHLKDGEEISLINIPIGATYKITELANEYRASYKLVDSKNLGKVDAAEDSNATVRTDLSTAEETVNEGEDVTVTFTNEKVKKDLTVTKEVDFTNGNKDQFDYKTKEFEFDIAFTGLDKNTEYTIEYKQKDVTEVKTDKFTTDATGAYVLSVKLKDGQSVTIKDLATNATYQITERAIKNYVASYTASGSANAEIIKTERSNLKPNTSLKTEVETVDPNDKDVRFVYRNTYTKSTAVLPKTGLSDIKEFLMITMFGTLLFAALYIIFDKKSRKLTK